MIHLPTKAAEELRHSETEHSITYAVAFAMLTLVMTIAVALFGVVLTLPFTGYLTGLVFLLGGMVVGLVLLTGLRRGRWYLARVLQIAEDWIDAELKSKAAPAIPAAPQIAPVMSGIAKPELAGGFDKRDLQRLCELFSMGAKWTERVMIGSALPITREELTKERYYALMDLFKARGIIGNRGGGGKNTGELLITDPVEMMKRINSETPAPVVV